MSLNESSATALVRITGLAIACFNQQTQSCEIGIIRDYRHELSLKLQRPVFQEGSNDVISYQDIAAYQALPKDDVQIEIKAVGQAAIAGYEIYQSGDFDRLDSADANDFRWIVDLNRLHADVPLIASNQECYPLTKLCIRNGLFYTSKLDTNLCFEKIRKDAAANVTQREVFGNVAETIGVKIEAEEVSFTICVGGKETTHSLKRIEGLPYVIRIENMDHNADAVYSDMPDYYKYLSSTNGDRFELTPIVEDGDEGTAAGRPVNTMDFCHPIVVDLQSVDQLGR